MLKKKIQKQKAFTLIELLIVIAIIGLLASITSVSLLNARIKSRDVKRMADVRQMITGLELYYNQNNQYPSGGGATNPNAAWSNSADSSWVTLQAQINSAIAKLPPDPLNQAGGWANSGFYNYSYYGGTSYSCKANQWYMIVYKLEKGASVVSPGVKACDNTVFQYNGGALNTANSNGIITVGVN